MSNVQNFEEFETAFKHDSAQVPSLSQKLKGKKIDFEQPANSVTQ